MGGSGFLRAHWALMPYCSGQLSVLMIEVGCEQRGLRRERRDHRPAKLVPPATAPPTQSKANADGKRALREWHNASMPIVREPTMPPLVHRFVVFAVVYFVIVLGWGQWEGGHRATGIIVLGVVNSAAAGVAWIAAIVAARFFVSPLVRFAIHVALVFVLFVVGSIGILLVLGFNLVRDLGLVLTLVLILGAIATTAAFADGVIGLWKDWRIVRAGG